MHYALQIDEILINIFSGPLAPSKAWKCDLFTRADLAALARTCRAFNGPALDLLWSELDDLDPLVHLLPEPFIQVHRGHKGCYDFPRLLKQSQWDIIRSYARRVHSVKDLEFKLAFHPKCIEILLNPPSPDPLFPNLRYVCCTFANTVNPFLQRPLPSLITLDCSFNPTTNTSVCWDSLSTIRNVTRLYMRITQPEIPRFTTSEPIVFKLDSAIDRVVSDAICRWSDLRIVSCGHFALTLDAIKHLSHAENLTRLSFALEVTLLDQITSFDALVCFRRLQDLEVLCTGPSTEASSLLSNLHLPSITDLTVKFNVLPSKGDVESFLDVMKRSGIGGTLRKFCFVHGHSYRSPSNYVVEASAVDVLGYNDLQPIMGFRNLRVLDFNVMWGIGLTGENLVALASAWPYLEELTINRHWGWNKGPHDCVIPLEDVIRLLQSRPSLKKLALSIDIGSAVMQHISPPIDLSDLPEIIEIDVLDTDTIDEATMFTIISLLTHLIPTGWPLLSLYKSHDYWPDDKEQAQCWDKLSERLQLAYR